MGDRWVENFALRMRGRCSYPIIDEILRYEIFRKKREKCSALQKMPKNGRNLQCAANF